MKPAYRSPLQQLGWFAQGAQERLPLDTQPPSERQRNKQRALSNITSPIQMINSLIFTYKHILCVHVLSLHCYMSTCISVLGLAVAYCPSITPNKGSGAPSVSSMRARTSGVSRVCLRDNKQQAFCICKCRPACEMSSTWTHLLRSSKSIFCEVFGFTSRPIINWSSSGGQKVESCRG